MARLSRLRPSPSMAVALLALFIALGGTAYAVGSINGAKLKNRSVAAKKLKRHTITGKEINFRKLGTVPSARNALNSSALGGKGASAYISGLDTRTSAGATENCGPVAPSGEAGCTVPCPAGEFALSGGLASGSTGGYLYTDTPVTRSGTPVVPGQAAAGWAVGWHNSGTGSQAIRAYVICAQVGSAATTEAQGLTGIG